MQPVTAASVIASLFIQALREGQSLWFRVASSSMTPLMQVDDNVFIQPATASEIHPGEIAAFESANGLVIHRIIHRQQTEESIRLLQMSDVEPAASWVKDHAIVGRVVAIRRDGRQVDLQHPIAKWWGTVTAYIRYRLYLQGKNKPLRMLLRVCSRLAIYSGCWCIRRFCASPATDN